MKNANCNSRNIKVGEEEEEGKEVKFQVLTDSQFFLPLQTLHFKGRKKWMRGGCMKWEEGF